MNKLLTFSLGFAILTGAGPALPETATSPSAAEWQIGPTIRSRNYSVGMPSRPTQTAEGWQFDFPFPHPGVGHVHAATTRTGSLEGKSRIRMRYRIDAAKGVTFAPQEKPDAEARLAFFIQRKGDNWTAKGRYEHYRWYAVAEHRVPLAPGLHDVTLTLDPENWKSIYRTRGHQAPGPFREALRHAESVGFVFGGGGSPGHGVFATGPARFTLLSFQVL